MFEECLLSDRILRRNQLLLAILLALCVSGCVHSQALPFPFQAARTLDGRPLPPHRDYWNAFRNPSGSNVSGLYMLQPYQPGRIPLVLIHGLASDALTWEGVVNSLNSDPNIRSRYQIWVYQYPTGNSYLKAAADLRRELRTVRATLDPAGTDAAIDQTVLVGHSMGGLVARLQVCYSDQNLWQAVSDVPLETVLESGPIHEDTFSALWFEPVPFVKRVVYIATPHHGSNWAQHPLGKLGRWLIDVPETVRDDYVALIRGNPGLFRNPSFQPETSLDHLSPGHPIMRATSMLRYAPNVQTHSLIGTGYLSPDGYMGDGVVPVISARMPFVQTEYFVNATHSGILRNNAATGELMCVLSTF